MTRHVRLLGVGALVAGLAVAAPGYAATTLGQTVVPTAPNGCSGFVDFDGFQEIKDGVSAASRVSGVITSWTFQAGTTTTSRVSLRVFRVGTAPETWQAVTDVTPLQTVPANSGLHSYASRVPLSAGDFIGLHADSGGCFANVTTESQVRYNYEITPLATDSPTSFGFVAAVFDLSAVVEPDADHDGYGDETQDGCPSSAATQVSCTETTILKKPKRTSHGPTSKLTFVSNASGATFSCTLDKKKAKACTSPVKYKCLRPGKHSFSVVATSPFGYADPASATTTFKIPRNRPGC